MKDDKKPWSADHHCSAGQGAVDLVQREGDEESPGSAPSIAERSPLCHRREAPTIAEAPTPEEINYSPLLPPHPTNSYIPLGLCNNFMLLSILAIPIYISLSTFKASCHPKSPFSAL